MNIPALTSGLALCTALLMTGCTLNGIANSNVSIIDNEGKATIKKTVKINDFDEIEASQGIKIIFVQAPNNGTAEIATTPSAEKYLKIEVKDKTLKAYYTNPDLKKANIKGPSIVRVSSPQINEVDLSSAANLTVEGDLKINGELEIDLSSAASLNAGTISCQKLDVETSSSASINIAGVKGDVEADASSASSISIGSAVGNLDANASSAASINIDALKSQNISAVASSAGSINLSGISGGYVGANASSGAKITLSGKATSLNKDTSSGGSVKDKALSIAR